MGFWKEVKRQWTKEGIKKSFQDLGWQGFLCILVAVVTADIAIDYFNIRENVLLHFAVFFPAWIFGYIICYYLINLIQKWKEKN